MNEDVVYNEKHKILYKHFKMFECIISGTLNVSMVIVIRFITINLYIFKSSTKRFL